MKKLLFMLVLLSAVTANATTYYVRNGGNDGNSGEDSANAWATMYKASTGLSSGDTCYIYGGVYGLTGEDANDNFMCNYGNTPHTYAVLAPQTSGADESHRVYYIGLPANGRSRPLILGFDSTVVLTAGTTLRCACFCGYDLSYVTFDNLEFAYSYKGVLISRAQHITFHDCKSSSACATSGDSNAGAYTLGMFSGGQRYIRFVSCEAAGPMKSSSGGSAWTAMSVGSGNNLDGWHSYVTQQSCWDSCFINDDRGMYAWIGWKTLNYQDTLRNCTFKDTVTGHSAWAIRTGTYSTGGTYNYSGFVTCGQYIIYGNIFINPNEGIVESGEGYSYTWNVDTIYFFNNTVYDIGNRGYVISTAAMNSGGTPDPPAADNVSDNQYIFNNIWMGTPSGAYMDIGNTSYFNTSNSVLDNNCFYGSSSHVGNWSGLKNLAAWQSASSQDANSQYIDPNLTDPANGDFSWTDSTPAFIRTGGTTVDGLGSSYIGAIGEPDTTFSHVTSIVSHTRYTVDLSSSFSNIYTAVDSLIFHIDGSNPPVTPVDTIYDPANPQASAFSGLVPGYTYYIQTIAIDQYPTYDTSAVVSFTAYDSLDPVDDTLAVGQDTAAVSSSISYAEGPLVYVWYLLDTDNPPTVRYDSVASPGDPQTHTLSGLLPSTTYYLRTIFEDSTMTDTANTVLEFTTQATAAPGPQRHKLKGIKK
jgi:hypothetical protein